MFALNYLKAIVAGVGAGVLWPVIDYLWGLIPGLPLEVHTALDILTCAVLTGGAAAAVPNRNQANLQPGQVVVAASDIPSGTVVIKDHK